MEDGISDEQILCSLAYYGFPLVTPQPIEEYPPLVLEDLVVRILQLPSEPRYVEGISVMLIQGHYDPEKLIRYAINTQQQNRIGYLAELALRKLASLEEEQRIRFRDKEHCLQHMVDKLHDAQIDIWQPLISAMPDWYIELIKEESQKDPLRAKWKIITKYVQEEADKHFRTYLRI